MNVAEFLAESSKLLTTAGIATARLDCLVLLEDTLGKDRTHLLAHTDMPLSPEQYTELVYKVQRRAKHEPLAYIRKKAEFYGREFYIDHRVLVPRPETEAIIDVCKLLPLPERPAVLDIGTGSGILAITANFELPESTVYGSDIDESCLAVARLNAHALHAAITFIRGDMLLLPVSVVRHLDVLLCNLPYVPNNHEINKAAVYEPKRALFAGSDGLSAYRRLFRQVANLPHPPAYIISEALPEQHRSVAHLAQKAGYGLWNVTGFVQTFAK